MPANPALFSRSEARDCGHDEAASEQETEWQAPNEEEIRKRAYQLYLDRMRECGGPLDDWLEAEAELLLRRSDR
jgi:Protein of unknown function (DUF2934)